MSIYATLWSIQIQAPASPSTMPKWIKVTAQAVPPHIGSPTPGCGYEDEDPYGEFLPPPVSTNKDGEADHTILSRSGLEETGQDGCLLRIGEGSKLRLNCFGSKTASCLGFHVHSISLQLGNPCRMFLVVASASNASGSNDPLHFMNSLCRSCLGSAIASR